MDSVDRLMQELCFQLRGEKWNYIDLKLLSMAGQAVPEGEDFTEQDAKDYQALHGMFDKALRRTFPGYDLACLAQFAREEPEAAPEADGAMEGVKEECQTS
jgi:hypothetical protein